MAPHSRELLGIDGVHFRRAVVVTRGMRKRRWPPGMTHARLLLRVARRLLDLHDHLGMVGVTGLTWFVVDVRGIWGRACGDLVVGREVVERSIRFAIADDHVPAMPFPIEGADALVLIRQLEPGLVKLVLERPAGETPILVSDADDVPALVWMSEIQDLRLGSA